METEAPALSFTDLSEQLEGPDGGAIAAKLCSRFMNLQAQAKSRLREGLPPDEYEATLRQDAALAAARRVLSLISSRKKHR